MRVNPQRLGEPKPTVTVVIPCYNYARYLPAAVGSVLSQSGVQADVVIVDDASSDDSLAVGRALEANDPRITVLAHARNAGPVQTFNDGLAAVHGEFLVRLDADDLLTPGSLERSVAVARRCDALDHLARPVMAYRPLLLRFQCDLIPGSLDADFCCQRSGWPTTSGPYA